MTTKGRLNPFGDSSKNFVFFPSLSHKKGVHRIVRGLESNCGLILLTGEIGIGKTSLARHIQSYLSDRFVFVELGNPYQTPLEQVFFCCEKFGLDTTGLSSIHDCVGKLEKYFHTVLEEGKRPVIVFDESHLLTKRHLSLIHILSNLRAEDGPLVQILLVGQLEILDLLATEGMEALNQRIGVRCELSPLALEDTDKYISFKMEKSGRPGVVSFSREAVERIWKQSSGLPRLINHVCAHALDALAFRDTNVVTPGMVDEVCRDSVYTGMFKAKTNKDDDRKADWRLWAMGGVATVAVASVFVVWFMMGGGFGTLPAGEPEPPEVAVQQPDPAPETAPEPEVASTPEPEPEVASETVVEDAQEAALEVASIEVEEAPLETDDRPEVLVVVDDPLGSVEPEPEQEEAQELSSAIVRYDPTNALDGSFHPAINSLVIGAIAWNEAPESSVVVINSSLLHEGETVDGVKVLNIGQDYILFEYVGEVYRLAFAR